MRYVLHLAEPDGAAMTRRRRDLNAVAQKSIDAFNVQEIKDEIGHRWLGHEIVSIKVGLIKPGRYRVEFVAVDE